MTDSADHAIPSHCENCETALQGGYCHHCGQSVHNPLRHAGHALEEFFEAFWHLDGRVFRTLRDLFFPGRVANSYIAGHRQRYIAPLRLFVILSVLTFFIGKLTVHIEGDAFTVDTANGTGQIANRSFADANTVEEVTQERERILADLTRARGETGRTVPGVDGILIAAQTKVHSDAANRIAEIRRTQARSGNADVPEDGKGEASADAEPTQKQTDDVLPTPSEEDGLSVDPITISWLPDFANHWLDGRVKRINDNARRLGSNSDSWLQVFMASLPSALFVLVPLFALMLKLAYLTKRRLYLEHLVVALYSHAFLLLALTAIFLLGGLRNAVEAGMPMLGQGLDMARLLVFLWMPLYLLLMQKRVYRQGWLLTGIKYFIIGNLHFLLLSLATVLMFMATLAKS